MVPTMLSLCNRSPFLQYVHLSLSKVYLSNVASQILEHYTSGFVRGLCSALLCVLSPCS